MAKLTAINQERLKLLNGCEIRTSLYESFHGVVGVDGNKVIDSGKVLDVLDSNKKIDKLWKDFYYQEMGEAYE